jgi:hypothetical protein
MRSTALILAMTTILALVVGCSSTGYEKAGSTSTSLERAASTIDETSAQINVTLAALGDLTSRPGPDLTKQFKYFDSTVNDLDALVRDIDSKTAAMREKRTEFFDQWDRDVATIQNENIRARSVQRKSDVMAHFNKVEASYVQVQTAFGPFMSDIRDIRAALTSDLTTAGIATIQEPARKAKRDAEPARKALTQLATEFRELGVKLSASAPQPASK